MNMLFSLNECYTYMINEKKRVFIIQMNKLKQLKPSVNCFQVEKTKQLDKMHTIIS